MGREATGARRRWSLVRVQRVLAPARAQDEVGGDLARPSGHLVPHADESSQVLVGGPFRDHVESGQRVPGP